MVAVHSLGLHQPSGLQHLVTEGYLPNNPQPEDYHWRLHQNGPLEEELLWTSQCVIWSRGRIVQKIYSVKVEEQNVQHALLTTFPGEDPEHLSENSSRPSNSRDRQRALVIVLQEQMHIFFLTGVSHLIKLQFEIESIFPAERGLILQRRVSASPNSSLKYPPPPQNSFLAPPSSLSQSSGYDPSALDFNALLSTASNDDEYVPRHYALTSPLSELSLIISDTTSPRNSLSLPGDPSPSWQVLDRSEKIVYISPTNELADTTSTEDPVLVLVTVKETTGVCSVWQASYMRSKPVSHFVSKKDIKSLTKARRRSSYMPSTGTTTPGRSRHRESQGASFSKAPAKNIANTKRRRTRASTKVAEEALASRVDPDYESRSVAQSHRRVSSMLSRAEFNESFDRNVFQDLASQRTVTNQSFGQSMRRGYSVGGARDRHSLGGPRRSLRLRASTPGNLSRLSLEDNSESGATTVLAKSRLSMAGDDIDPETLASKTDTMDLYHPLDGLKKEIFVRKCMEFELNSTDLLKVQTVPAPLNGAENEHMNRRLFVLVLNKATKECVQVDLVTGKHASSTNRSRKKSHPHLFLMPTLRTPLRFHNIVDLSLLKDHHSKIIGISKFQPLHLNMCAGVWGPWTVNMNRS